MQAYKPTYTLARMELPLRMKAARKHAGLTQKQLAEAASVEQPLISQLETGKTLKSAHIAQIAKACGVNAIWLASGEGQMLGDDDNGIHPRTPHDSEYALIPQYSAKGACGDGYMNGHVEIKGGLAFRRDWLAKMKVRPENLYVIYAEGDSMEPYIFEGDVVLFDSSDLELRDRQVYAIRRPDGGISIKRILQQLSGRWIIHSDNQGKYSPEPIGEDVLHHIPILGRVIWRAGGVGG